MKLSIITINYNNLDGLKRTVESIVNQTWQEFEYIVIDGGSTDGSAQYIQSQVEHIDYWVSEPDSGIYNAMNKGITKATGEYLLFLNSGDHLYSNIVLQENYNLLADTDLIYFNVKVVGENTLKIVKHPDELRFFYFYINGLNHQSVLIRKVLFQTVGLYDENLKIVSDWKFFIVALFKYNCSYTNINKILSTYYLGGISSKIDHKNERDKVLNEHFGGFILDCEEILLLKKNEEMMNTNRFIMLLEIEKSILGKKIVSIFLRFFIVLFMNIKLNNILNKK
jgi:glycosyltransferase involved in cell wall biosynthesis